MHHVALFLFAALVLAGPAQAGDLSGEWEIQSMGGDRAVHVEQKGRKVIAHRVLWPEFEGERYKLEHLYRGARSGNTISGELLVKEEELPDFEILRTFTARVDSDSKMVWDGLPMRRVGRAKAPARRPKIPPRVEPPSRPIEPPGSAKAPTAPDAPAVAHVPRRPDGPAVPQAPAPPDAPRPPFPPAGATGGTVAEPTDPGAKLFANIMGTPGIDGLFTVSAQVTLPDGAAELTAEGDALYAKGDYQGALAKFDDATKLGNKRNVRLIHRIGRCYLALGKRTEAAGHLRRASRLDPHNKRIRRDYRRAKKGK